MSVVNRVKGFVRRVSGIPPLTLPDCVDEDSLIDYTIAGNGIGEKTKNLFNEATDIVRKYNGDNTVNGYECFRIYDYSADCGYDADGSGAYGRAIFEIAVDLKANKTYTISAKFLRGYNANGSTSNDAFQARIACKYSDGTYMTSSNESFFAYGTAHSTTTPKQGAWTITPAKDISRIQIQYYMSGNSYCWMLKNSLKIEEGSKVTTYEPYGYKIPVVCSGKNLVRDEKYYNTTVQYGTVVSGTLNLKKGITYTLSLNTPKTNIQLQFVKWQATGEGYKLITCNGNRVSITITPKEDISFSGSNAIIQRNTATSEKGTGLCSDFMVEQKTVATDYEPYVEPVTTNIYLNEPLSEGEMLKNPVKLPTVKGTTIYTINTDIQPTGMSATYYSTNKE